jgi:hypothetical protein
MKNSAKVSHGFIVLHRPSPPRSRMQTRIESELTFEESVDDRIKIDLCRCVCHGLCFLDPLCKFCEIWDVGVAIDSGGGWTW